MDNLRHSCAHLLAAAVMELWPETKRTIGPAIENGFYYDFDFGAVKISEENFPKIEAKMHELVKSWNEFEKSEVTQKVAKEAYKGNEYKLELIEEFSKEEQKLTFYKSGNYSDLCRGGHIEKPSEELKHFKLLSIAGAYWRGSEKNKMLYLELVNFWRKEHEKYNYQEIVSPLINKKELYETSGHWDHYKENMFISETEEKEVYALKPMNCPNAMVVFGSDTRSYRDLPLKLSDTDTLHRYEKSGTLNGLLRIREFRQDDAHIFISEDQIEEQYKELFEIVERFYSVFGLKYSYRLGTIPEKYMGDKKVWDKAENVLKGILEKSGKEFTVLEGDGAFYGPKIDILMKDSLGRDWQMGTLQLDFQIPARFGLKYSAQDGTQKTPVVIHRVVYGSLERFIGIIIEHFGGNFPTWLTPIQVKILPIAERHMPYALSVTQELKNKNIRVELDERSETLGNKIRNAQNEKVPYMLVLGDKEIENNEVSIRNRAGENSTMQLSKFTENIKKEIEKKKLN